MPHSKNSFLDIDPKIIERNLIIEECKPPGLEEYKALLGISSEDKAPWTLVTPKPGFCVKTTDEKEQKTFINICTLDELPEPKDVDEDTLLSIIESQDAEEYRVPLSLQEPREVADKAGQPCPCYDVAINPKFFAKVSSSPVFKMFLLQVTFDGLKDKFGVDLNIEDYVILERKKCMGTLSQHRIRKTATPAPQLKPLVEEITTSEPPVKTKNSEIDHQFVRAWNDGSEYLYGKILLPETLLAKDLHFELGPNRVVVECRRSDNILDLNLPVNVDPSKTVSEFSTKDRILQFVSLIVP